MSTPPLLGALAVAAGRLRGARSAYWAMDIYPDLAIGLGVLRRNGLVGRMLTAVSRWALRSADLVVALGETMAGRLKKLGAKNVLTVHNWADGEAIRPMSTAVSVYRRDRRWGEKFVVEYSGNLGLVHEFETVLKAADVLRDDRDILFALVGSGPRKAEVEAEVGRLGLTNVELHPPVSRDRLGDTLAAGDVHMVTLRPGMEGLVVPSKIYGILAAGRPAVYVGPPEGEVHDIVEGGRCGMSVRNVDVDGLVAAIRRLRDDVALRTTMGECARRLFDERFTLERQTGLILEELERLCAASD